MSRSKIVQALLTQFPALKPVGIERLLATHGIKVDSNLVVVARHRNRRKRSPERLCCEVVTHLLQRRGDLMARVVAEFDWLIQAVLQTTTANPELNSAQVADHLMKLLDARPSHELPTARLSRVFMRVLDQHPQYRRSMELVTGASPGGIAFVIPVGVGLDDATDEQLEEMILCYLEDRYPPGTTVEEVARAYLDGLRHRAGSSAPQDEATSASDRGRAVRIQVEVVSSCGAAVANPDAVLQLVRHLLELIPEWTDDAITQRIVSSIGQEIGREEKPVLLTEGLTVRDRP